MKSKPEFKFNESIENRCVNYLKRFHLGKHNSIPHKLLATRIGVGPRRVRSLISHLVKEHKIPIGSTSDSGIYYINSFKDMDQAYRELMSRSDKIILRAFSLKQAYKESIKNDKQLKLL